jgi:hypothetical protein
MQYAVLFHDTVVRYSAFEEPHVLMGIVKGRFEPTPGFERLRPLSPAFEPKAGQQTLRVPATGAP